jgi:hypothetical protein
MALLVGDTIGLSSNSRLEAMAASLAEDAKQQRSETGQKVRLFDQGQYQAGSWEYLYTWYTQRGNHPELCIN